MALFSANLENLRALYNKQLEAMYSVEMQLTEALPKMADAATNAKLKDAFTTHLQETRQHASRVKEILTRAQQQAGSDKCKAMAALIDSGETMIKDAKDEAVRDASLILAAQRVEHFEIASYGTLRGWAELLGEQQPAQLLEEILRQEGHADQLLTEISQAANARARRAA